MGLETATYISQLVATNPLGTDPKSQGDNHIQLIKGVLQTQFPNFGAAAMNATVAELNYSVGLTGLIQTQIDAKVTALNAALTGIPTAPTASPGTSTTQIATTAFAAALAFSSALPAQAGNAGKYVTTDGTTASWAAITSPEQITRVITAADTAIATDRQKVIQYTGGSSVSLALTAAATLGDGWYCYVQNSTTAFKLTIDPNGAELIDGLSTLIMPPGEVRMIRCDGPAFKSVKISGDNIMIVRDEKTSGTTGGTPTGAVYQTRTLNTIQYNSLGATLAGNNVTVDPGTYYIEASAPAQTVGEHVLRLWNNTAGTTAIQGTADRATAAGTMTRSVVRGVVTFTVSTSIRLEQYFGTAVANGMGQATIQGTEVYAEMTIRKLA